MKITAITLAAALTGAPLQAESSGDRERKVSVCIESHAPGDVTARARWLASRMFARIGVSLAWHNGWRDCPSQSILITMSDGTPASLNRNVLAYALPYEGTHIHVFYNRIARNYTQSLVPTVLAHVLTHEITHLLQGISRHSEHGIMKARWTSDDFAVMACKPLEFEPDDIELIYRGLAARTARSLLAQNTAPGTVAAK